MTWTGNGLHTYDTTLRGRSMLLWAILLFYYIQSSYRRKYPKVLFFWSMAVGWENIVKIQFNTEFKFLILPVLVIEVSSSCNLQ
jgi:hypothetical protein